MPERREERTTEGGLDVAGQRRRAARRWSRELGDAGIRVSLFIAAERGADRGRRERLPSPAIEIHTGAWCEALAGTKPGAPTAEFGRIRAGATLARGFGLEVHAGHGLDYATAETIAAFRNWPNSISAIS